MGHQVELRNQYDIMHIALVDTGASKALLHGPMALRKSSMFYREPGLPQ